MGAAHSRSVRERRERVQRQEEGMPPSTIPARRTREDDDSGQEHQDRGLRRRRLLSVPRGADDENMEVDEERALENGLSLIHISEPTRHFKRSRMPSSA